MLSYTECKAGPGAGGLVGLRRADPALPVALRASCSCSDPGMVDTQHGTEQELSRPI